MSDQTSVNESFASFEGLLNAHRLARQQPSLDVVSNAEATAALYKAFESKMAAITRDVEEVQENVAAILTNLQNITPAMNEALIGVENKLSSPTEAATGPVPKAKSVSSVDR